MIKVVYSCYLCSSGDGPYGVVTRWLLNDVKKAAMSGSLFRRPLFDEQKSKTLNMKKVSMLFLLGLGWIS